MMQVTPMTTVDYTQLTTKPDKHEQRVQISSHDLINDKAKQYPHVIDDNKFAVKSLAVALNDTLIESERIQMSSVFNPSFSAMAQPSPLRHHQAIQPVEFNFDKVAENVMNFISDAIFSEKSEGVTDDTLKSMLTQARQGVDLGFEQARQELTSMNILSDDIKEGMDKSYQIIDHKLSELSNDLFNPRTTVETSATQYSELTEQSIERNTHAKSVETALSAVERDIIAVNDVKNTGVQATIDTVVKRMGDLADHYVQNNVQKSYEKLRQLEFDAVELTNLALGFESNKHKGFNQWYRAGQPESAMDNVTAYIKAFHDISHSAQTLMSQQHLQQIMEIVGQQKLKSAGGDMLSNFVSFNQKLGLTL